MAEMPPLHLPCLACEHVIEVPVTVKPGNSLLDVEVTVTIDHEPIQQHADEHTAGGRMSEQPQEFAGRLAITWPKAGPSLPGWAVVLTDADTGQQITSALDLTIHMRPDEIVTAETTMVCNLDGKPLQEGEPVRWAEGAEEVPTGVFRWLVAEMRIAE